jgi:hypothetical protein
MVFDFPTYYNLDIYVDIDTMELNCDKISTCSKVIFEKKRLTWDFLKLTLGVEEMERLVEN